MRIAIVDDIETERALLKMRLERQLSLYGVETEILEFDSSESFLAAEKERHFTVAFLDIYMKGLSGMDAAKELFSAGSRTKLIFLSSSTDFLRQSYSVRAVYYLVKPIVPEEFEQAMAFLELQPDYIRKQSMKISDLYQSKEAGDKSMQ